MLKCGSCEGSGCGTLRCNINEVDVSRSAVYTLPFDAVVEMQLPDLTLSLANVEYLRNFKFASVE